MVGRGYTAGILSAYHVACIVGPYQSIYWPPYCYPLIDVGCPAMLGVQLNRGSVSVLVATPRIGLIRCLVVVINGPARLPTSILTACHATSDKTTRSLRAVATVEVVRLQRIIVSPPRQGDNHTFPYHQQGTAVHSHPV